MESTLYKDPCENMKIYMEITMQKWVYAATNAHAGAFRNECKPQKQFSDSGSLLETWVKMFLFMI